MSSEESVRVSISSHTGLHPDEIARRTFPTARKGVDPEAVRRFLEAVASEMREMEDREQALRRRLADAERRALEPELDEQTLLRAVGAETARILQTAHESAADVVGKAEARAAELIQTASEESTADAAAIRGAASSEATAVTDAARTEAVALMEATRAECRRIVREARELRSNVLGDLSQRRRELRVQLEQLRTGRDSLLDVVDAVGDAVDQLRDRLANAEHEARLAAAEAGDRVAASDEEEGDLVGEEEIELAVDLEEAGLDEVLAEHLEAADDDTSASTPAGETAAESAAVLADAAESVSEPKPAVEEVAAVAEGDPADRAPSSELYDVEADLAADREAEEAAIEAAADVEPAIAPHRSVDELFAKIRASRSDSAPANGEAPASADSAGNGKAAEGLEQPSAEAAESPEPPTTEAAGSPEAAESPEATESPEVEASASEAEAEATATAEEAPVSPGADDAETGDDPAQAALAKRQQLVGSVTTKLGRALKRTLQDDQNILLDALRHSSGAPDLDAALPEAPQRQRIETATVAALAEAWSIGHHWLGGGDAPKSAALEAGRSMSGDLAVEVTRLLRHRLHEALGGYGESSDGGADAASAAYREWRSGRIDSTAADYITRAFGSGAIAGGKGTPVTWIVDDEGGPCPDCDDNALAGEVQAGEEFPTGQPHPPVHPGCRCLLVPTTS